ncbi:hypothetical protein U9M48_003319 [Paspalum notatum var. saurae]|uniref:Uncharacterized protein n=1 Tax=Paspalum notatum var. saurae TaxID=547442 RepID=A0AAQ3PSN5_PASNO
MIPDDIQGCSPTTQCVLPSSLVISPGHHHVLCCSPSNPNPRSFRLVSHPFEIDDMILDE